MTGLVVGSGGQMLSVSVDVAALDESGAELPPAPARTALAEASPAAAPDVAPGAKA